MFSEYLPLKFEIRRKPKVETFHESNIVKLEENNENWRKKREKLVKNELL